jgi:hypothetical protein
MKAWNKLSILSKYYIVSFANLAVWYGLISLIGVYFVDQIFFLTAFVWHFALQTPGLREKVMTNHHKLSFLAVIVRLNHYLQIFINIKRLPYASSFIRAISPVLFTLLLFLLGGHGNVLFTLIGSFCFEVVYVYVKKRTDFFGVSPLAHTGGPDTPPTIPNVEKTHE